jgi:hypothetical protein
MVFSNEGNDMILCFLQLRCRTDREKETSGMPDIPNSGRLIELEYASISDRKIRSQLRNPGDIEKTVSFQEPGQCPPEFMT